MTAIEHTEHADVEHGHGHDEPHTGQHKPNSFYIKVAVALAIVTGVEVGLYYRRARGVPAGNVVHVRLPGHATRLSAAEFTTLKAGIR